MVRFNLRERNCWEQYQSQPSLSSPQAAVLGFNPLELCPSAFTGFIDWNPISFLDYSVTFWGPGSVSITPSQKCNLLAHLLQVPKNSNYLNFKLTFSHNSNYLGTLDLCIIISGSSATDNIHMICTTFKINYT